MHRPTRRDLIRTGIGGAAAAVAGGALRNVAAAEADILGDAQGDAAVLERIAAIEQLIAFAYDHVLSKIPLSPKADALLRSFAAQEREHVRRLSNALRDLGHTPPPPATDADSVSRRLASLHGSGSLTSFAREVGALEYLVGIETVAESAYYSATSKLSDPRLVVLAAGILGCEAQHWTSLEELLHPGDVMQSVPYSTVHG
jgi:Ferritin-like domain